MKKLLTTLVTVIVMNLPISCIQDDCGNSGPLESRVTELTPTIGSYSAGQYNTTASTNFQQAAIQVQITDNEYLRAYQPASSDFSFINQAYACDPAILDPAQQINHIKITAAESIFSNGAEFTPGTDLNSLFHVANLGKISIEAFIDQQNETPIIFGNHGDEIILMLKNAPDMSINQKLKMEIEFNVGENFQLDTDFLKIDV